jgi:tetratricopeptide (TPR) repeat protein
MPPASRDLDEGFFDHGEHAADVDAHAADLDNYDEKMAHKNSPEARARRAKLWRYVLGAVAACVFLLFIADVKSRWGHGEPVSDTPPMVAVMPPPPPPVNSAVVAPEPPPVAVVVPPATSADDLPAPAPVASGAASAKAGEPGAPAPADSKGWVAEPAAPAAAAAPGAPPAAAEPSADDKKSAAQQKRTCQGLLDQGAFAKAIEAGEHSVALDPTDGEAWLLLGAAYQSIGKGADARRTFASCVAEAKRGPINECRSMLH